MVKNVVCQLFLGDKDAIDQAEKRTEREDFVFNQLWKFIWDAVKIYDQFENVFVRIVKESIPYFGAADLHSYSCYVWNMMHSLAGLAQENRQEVVRFLIEKLLDVDLVAGGRKANAGQDSTLFQMEDSELQDREDTDTWSLMDVAVFTIMSFCDEVKADKVGNMNLDETFNLLLLAFESVVFSSRKCSFCQFIIFYFISLKQELYRSFVDMLWLKLESETEDDVIGAASYLSSLLTRSIEDMTTEEDVITFVQFCGNSLNSTLDHITESPSTIVSRQSLFFTLFQAMANVIVGKSSELSGDSLRILKLINIQRIVSSALNPLNVCPESLAGDFCKVCSHLQLAMCSAIIQRNTSSRPLLDKIEKNDVFNGRDNKIWLPFHSNASPLVLSKIRPFLNRSARSRLESLSHDLHSQDDKMSGISFSASPAFSAGLDNDIVMRGGHCITPSP